MENIPKMQIHSNHQTVRRLGLLLLLWVLRIPFRVHIFIIDHIRQLLIDILIMQQPRPPKHHTEVLVNRVHAPENALPELMLEVSGPGFGQRRCRGRPSAMQPERRYEL